MSVLAQRVLTAVILVPAVVAAVLELPSEWLALLLGSIVALGALEWARLAGVVGVAGQAAYMLLVGAGLLGAYVLVQSPSTRLWLPGLATLWWLLVTVRLLRMRAVDAVAGVNARQLAAGPVVLIPAWSALVLLHRQSGTGPELLLFLLVLIWVADSGAFFAGRRWGRTRLAPLVSPGKSRQGVYGALAGALICGIALAWYLGTGWGQRLGLVLLCLATVLLSISGDLYESLLKRRAGAKDSGALLPGHGGVLDRIDSLTAAAPAFVLGIQWLRGIS